MKSLFHHAFALLGAACFLVCTGMLLTWQMNFASDVPDLLEPIGPKVEDAAVRIVLDAGHGGMDGGTSHMALQEKVLALKTVGLVKTRLEAAQLENVEVVLTREDDTYLSLHQRVAMANRFPKCYFVSVHFNGSLNRSASGTETFFASPKPAIIQEQIRKRLGLARGTPIRDDCGERFAASVQSVLVGRLGSRDRGIRNNPRLVLPREVVAPSILVECVFLSNPAEALKVRRRGYLEKIADGVAEGILNYVRDTEQDPYADVIPLR